MSEEPHFIHAPSPPGGEPETPPPSGKGGILRRLRDSKRVRLWFAARHLKLKRDYRPMLLGRPMSREEVGAAGEALAARWLAGHGRRILRRNHRGPFHGEVDIVARHGRVLTFVEVKTRTSAEFGRPADAVDAQKRLLIQRGGQDWLRLLGRPRVRFRFDIVEVLLIPGMKPHVYVIVNAFQMPDSSMSGR